MLWTNSYSLAQLGEFLQDVRKERGYRQDEFARLLGISHTTLSNLEQGKNTSTETLQRVVRTLGLRMVLVPKAAKVAVSQDQEVQ